MINALNLSIVLVYVIFLVMKQNTKVINVGTQCSSAFESLAMFSLGLHNILFFVKVYNYIILSNSHSSFTNPNVCYFPSDTYTGSDLYAGSSSELKTPYDVLFTYELSRRVRNLHAHLCDYHCYTTILQHYDTIQYISLYRSSLAISYIGRIIGIRENPHMGHSKRLLYDANGCIK